MKSLSVKGKDVEKGRCFLFHPGDAAGSLSLSVPGRDGVPAPGVVSGVPLVLALLWFRVGSPAESFVVLARSVRGSPHTETGYLATRHLNEFERVLFVREFK